MSTKLEQKQLLKGFQVFEVIDDYVEVRSKAPFGTEEVSQVVLSVIDPEPVISESHLYFNSRVNGCPLLSLRLGKPNTEAFNAFVNLIKQKAREEFSDFAGLRPDSPLPELNGNQFEEPPEFDEPATKIRQDLNVDRINESVEMLEQYLNEEDVQLFIATLKELAENPEDPDLLKKTAQSFNDLGPRQGAVLTYAPYVGIILSDDPFSW